MTENIEYQFLNTQLQSNNYIKASFEYDIAQMLALIQQKKQSVKQLEDMNRELTYRINQLESNNKNLVLVNYLPELNNKLPND